MLLEAKQEIDATPGDEKEHFHKAIEACHKIAEHIELAYAAGDFGLGAS